MKAIVWSRELCGYCDMAKRFLEGKGIECEERKIGDGAWTKDDLLKVVPNARTVPQIFIDDEYVGGYDELVKWEKFNDN